jgi:F0F1-type ATP synthase alpha subunit
MMDDRMSKAIRIEKAAADHSPITDHRNCSVTCQRIPTNVISITDGRIYLEGPVLQAFVSRE